MSRLVTRLVRMGLATRSRSKTSHREVVVALSPKGKALVERLIPVAQRLEQTASAGLPPADLTVVKRALRQMHRNMTDLQSGRSQQLTSDRAASAGGTTRRRRAS